MEMFKCAFVAFFVLLFVSCATEDKADKVFDVIRQTKFLMWRKRQKRNIFR